MSFLKINHEQAGGSEYEIIAEGEYEVIVADAEIAESKSGYPMLKLTLTVRNDVPQPHRKQKLWDYMVASEKAMFKFQQVGKAVGLPNGKDFGTMEDYRNAILFQPVRVKVIHEDNTYNGETKKQARIKTYTRATVEYANAAQVNPFETVSEGAGLPTDFL